jgi:hypothetical protein
MEPVSYSSETTFHIKQVHEPDGDINPFGNFRFGTGWQD